MKNLYAALLKAQKQIRGVAKDSVNEGGTSSSGRERAKFNYVSIERMVSDARAVLHDNGLVLTTKGSATASGDSPILVQAWTLAHAESGEAIDIQTAMPIVVGAGKPADWATGAASSYALKYLLRDLLQIPRGEDAEGNDYGDYDPDAIGEEVYQREIKPLAIASGLTPDQVGAEVGKKFPGVIGKHPSLWPKVLKPQLIAWLEEVVAKRTPTEPATPTPVTPTPAAAAPAPSKTARLTSRIRNKPATAEAKPFI